MNDNTGKATDRQTDGRTDRRERRRIKGYELRACTWRSRLPPELHPLWCRSCWAGPSRPRPRASLCLPGQQRCPGGYLFAQPSCSGCCCCFFFPPAPPKPPVEGHLWSPGAAKFFTQTGGNLLSARSLDTATLQRRLFTPGSRSMLKSVSESDGRERLDAWPPPTR